jgi:hypothetical protein
MVRRWACALSFSLRPSLPPRMCVRAYVRASMYVCSACKPTASTAHSCICCVELPAADAQFYHPLLPHLLLAHLRLRAHAKLTF